MLTDVEKTERDDARAEASRSTKRAAPTLEHLRRLREQVREQCSGLEDDLRPFLDPQTNTFTQRPKSAEEIAQLTRDRPEMGTIDASTTSTVLMALVLGQKLELFYGQSSKPALSAAVTTLYSAKWTSVGLGDLNFFTTSLVFRALGFLVEHDDKVRKTFESADHQGTTYRDLAARFSSLDPATTVVDGAKSQYPLTPTLVYWLLDGADKLGWTITTSALRQWARWASDEFYRQLSHVTAKDDARMDPVALAMAACLVSKILRLASSRGVSEASTAEGAGAESPTDVLGILPSRDTIRVVLPRLFEHQGASGIWPKYFPLFVYPDGNSINHCFAFELMEALLSEFPDDLVVEHLAGIEKAVRWCKDHKIDSYVHPKKKDAKFRGWNSGANLQGLQERKPECWATAVVYTFLFRLDTVLSNTIQNRILAEYGAIRSDKSEEARLTLWNELLGSQPLIAGKRKDVKDLLKNILEDWDSKGKNSRRKRSVLLFGPPGTSKTSLVKRLAALKGWPLVSINPSHFLKDGLEAIFGRANEIFRDLMDLKKVVVFFDEMDPLVQRRNVESDIHHQSLTTVFLPKLADLYEQNDVAFFMATNHIQYIDPAIRRPGRFDYLLFVGPPRWSDKYKAIAGDRDDVKLLLDQWTTQWRSSDDEGGLVQILDRFTFDEMRALFAQIQTEPQRDLLEALKQLGPEEFAKQSRKWSEGYIVLWEKDGTLSEDYAEFLKDRESSRE